MKRALLPVTMILSLTASIAHAGTYTFCSDGYTGQNCGGMPPSLASMITINDKVGAGTYDYSSADVYPSIIDLSNLDPFELPGIVTKVTVTIEGFKHDYPADVDILLYGPEATFAPATSTTPSIIHGRNVLLMGDMGGSNIIKTSPITMTFDDDAIGTDGKPKYLPTTRIAIGTYRPTNILQVRDHFDAPVDQQDKDGNDPFSDNLSIFNARSPFGPWRLFVRDDQSNNKIGSIARWKITFETLEPGETAE